MLTILLEYLKLYLLDDVAYNQTPIQQEKNQCLMLMQCLMQTLHSQELYTTSRGGCHLRSTNNADTIPMYGVFVRFTHHFVGNRLNWDKDKCLEGVTDPSRSCWLIRGPGH